jgi:hypothetical protein
MAAHVNIRMVKCSACQLPNYEFEDKGELLDHIESAHNIDRDVAHYLATLEERISALEDRKT